MTRQVALRLPDPVVEYLDDVVRRGGAKSRADLVARAIERERRREAAERDVAILSQVHDDPTLHGLAEYSASVDMGDLD